ncbi:MAG: hypothetical protein ACLTDR_12660 [Adlercreutzia equolifaciens]
MLDQARASLWPVGGPQRSRARFLSWRSKSSSAWTVRGLHGLPAVPGLLKLKPLLSSRGGMREPKHLKLGFALVPMMDAMASTTPARPCSESLGAPRSPSGVGRRARLHPRR